MNKPETLNKMRKVEGNYSKGKVAVHDTGSEWDRKYTATKILLGTDESISLFFEKSVCGLMGK